tara:strand:+ start:73993 stop:74400 length:408 start_codon:yes stop_codon:yes gene_type:complete
LQQLKTHKIILFDGVCNLCNNSVNFVIKRDKNNVFKFAALQSEVGLKLASQLNIDTSNLDSIILIDNGKHYKKSNAALFIAKHLSGFWPLLFGFIILPKFTRDSVYDYVAKNRYNWFGKKDECMLPTAELKSKFL